MKNSKVLILILTTIIFLSSCADKEKEAIKKYPTVFDAVRMGDSLAVKGFIKKDPSLATTFEASSDLKYTPIVLAITMKGDAEENKAKGVAGKDPKYYDEVIKVLVDMNAGISAPIKNEDNPIIVASARGQKDIVEMLLSKGALLESKGTSGWTPLHTAVINKHRDVVEFLLNKGAKVNNRDANGDTPLHSAAGWGFKDIVILLLDKGAEVNAVDNFDKTPLDYAITNKHNEIVALLKENGGKEKTKGAPVMKPRNQPKK